jgi:hypothetical protein
MEVDSDDRRQEALAMSPGLSLSLPSMGHPSARAGSLLAPDFSGGA